MAEGIEKVSAELSQGVGDGGLVADWDPLPDGALVEGHVEGQTGVITPEEIALEERHASWFEPPVGTDSGPAATSGAPAAEYERS